MISQLIDKQDSFEIVRDQVAALLTLEGASQRAHALAAGVDPKPWTFKVFKERSNPIEDFLNDLENETPVINVWYDSSTFDKRSSNAIERQTSEGTINIDCYAVGYSEDTPGGHRAGDEQAAYNVQRCIRLARNILMAGEYTYLGLRGLVGGRWINSINLFQPPKDPQTVQNIIGARLQLVVNFNEFSPQVEAVPLEYLSLNVDRAESGELIAKIDFNYGVV